MRDLLNKWYNQSQQIAPVRIRGLDRKRLVHHYGEYGLVKGAEIGVDKGTFSEYMFKAIPDLQLFCVDPWRWKQRGEARYLETVEKLKPYPATIIRQDSVLASLGIADGSLDFVYIDGDHTFDYVMTDIILWAQKVRVGGIVSGHDYYRFRRAGVVPAVDIYTRQHNITRWFLTDERTPTWFWIKEESFVDPDPRQV